MSATAEFPAGVMQTNRLRGRLLRLESALGRLLTRAGNAVLRLVVRMLFAAEACSSPGNVVVFRSGTIGDIACCVPALSWLRQRWPAARIHFLSTPSGNPRYWSNRKFTPGAQLLPAGRVVDRIVLFSGADLVSPGRVLALRRQIRSLNPERTYLLPRTGEKASRILKKVLFLRLLGVRRNLHGYHVEKAFTVFRKAQFLDGGFDHQVVTALKAVGARNHDAVSFPLPIDPRIERRLDALWSAHGLDGRQVIGLFPGGKFAHKRWLLENFARLCAALAEEREVAIILLGGPEDTALARQLVAACAAPLVNLAGETSLGETAALLRRCQLYVGNDSGPSHLAAAVGTPCVTLFASIVFPGIWEPWGRGNTSLRHRVPCEYCFSEDHCPRGTMECIRGIPVEEVLRVVRGYLAMFRRKTQTAPPPATDFLSC